jgi:hypothetical protein
MAEECSKRMTPEEAQALIDDETFIAIIAELEKQLLDEMHYSEPHEREKREEAYYQLRALIMIQHRLSGAASALARYRAKDENRKLMS